MQIITSLPRDLDGKVQSALIKEIKTGFQLAKAMEDKEEIIAAQEAQAMRGSRTLKGLGKHVAEIPQDGFFRLVKKYGWEEVHSKEFVRYMNKRMPHLTSAKV